MGAAAATNGRQLKPWKVSCFDVFLLELVITEPINRTGTKGGGVVLFGPETVPVIRREWAGEWKVGGASSEHLWLQ